MAVAYDFDGTLAPGNMQEHSFIPEIEMKTTDFWQEVKRAAKEQDMDEILAYMQRMLTLAHQKGVKVQKQAFRRHGSKIQLFPGLPEWFDRITEFAMLQGITLEHHIISSGLREMIEGTPVAKKMKHIFASGFAYDQHNVAIWPAVAVNYTTKTQYLFRVNKGIMNSYDNARINKFIPDDERYIPFESMIYIGDGETDVPCMKMLKYQRGHSIAVYDHEKRGSKMRKSPKTIAQSMIKEGRADYAVPAEYSNGSELDALVKALIEMIAARARARGSRLQTSKRAPSSQSETAASPIGKGGTADC